MFALPIAKPHFKTIIFFIKIALKLSYFWKKMQNFRALGALPQRWKPVGSRFFNRPVKPVEKPVEFSFLATKRYLSTNRNILVYFIINKPFYKKNSINKPHLSKTLVEWFQAVTNMLWSLRHTHPGTYLGWEYCAMPPTLGHGTKQKSAKYTLKSRDQILMKHACGIGLRYLAF